MKILLVGLALIVIVSNWTPVYAAQEAIIPAYAYVSTFQSSIAEYKKLLDNKNRAAARRLLHSKKVFISPKDVKVEVVSSDNNIAKVKLNQLGKNAEPVTLYFWTLADQLKVLSQQ